MRVIAKKQWLRRQSIARRNITEELYGEIDEIQEFRADRAAIIYDLFRCSA
jgi:hypothetical protein